MPQSLEVIQHARNSQVPLIIAVNKCDLPEAEPEKVLYQLAGQGIVVESLGGDVMSVNISAKTGMNIDELEKSVSLLAEMMELRAPDSGPAEGVVVESRKDKGLGPVASVVVTAGTFWWQAHSGARCASSATARAKR
jgi:translation initiation factor IF-2